MQDFLNILSSIFAWLSATPVFTFNLGDTSTSITFMQLFVGLAVAMIGITFLHHIFEW